MFSCPPSVLPYEAKDGWDLWFTNTLAYDTYRKEVKFFRTFNIA